MQKIPPRAVEIALANVIKAAFAYQKPSADESDGQEQADALNRAIADFGTTFNNAVYAAIEEHPQRKAARAAIRSALQPSRKIE